MTPLDLANVEIARLREALEDAKAEVRNLRLQLQGRAIKREIDEFRMRWRLTQKEAMVLHCLYAAGGNAVSKPVAIDCVYGLDSDEAPFDKIIDVFVCKIRRKLRDSGISFNVIAVMWGTGYLLTAAGLELCREVLAPLTQDAAA